MTEVDTSAEAQHAAEKLGRIVYHDYAGDAIMYNCDLAEISFNDIRALLSERDTLRREHDEARSTVVALGFFEDEFPTLCLPGDGNYSEVLQPMTLPEVLDLCNKLSEDLKSSPAPRQSVQDVETGYGASWMRGEKEWVLYSMPGTVPLGVTAKTDEACNLVVYALRALAQKEGE